VLTAPSFRDAPLGAGYDVQLHIRESILTIVVMDSGLALRAPRNDETNYKENERTQKETP
jgi:hypothetical protein